MEPVLDTPSPAVRQLAGEHARHVAELVDHHAVTLESILAALRSDRLDDRAARTIAIELAATSLVEIRTQTDLSRSSMVEPVIGAFARLRSDLRPLARFGGLDVQFVEPPTTGRALPGEIARAARAIVRTAVLAFVDDGDAHRVRIQWDCDGRNLLIGIRDDGKGELASHDDSLRPIAERVAALDGTVTVESTVGWGSEVQVTLPLDPPTDADRLEDSIELSPRERDVLSLIVAGSRNHEIATALTITDNTVKFHVSNLLRKAGVRSRSELVGLVGR